MLQHDQRVRYTASSEHPVMIVHHYTADGQVVCIWFTDETFRSKRAGWFDPEYLEPTEDKPDWWGSSSFTSFDLPEGVYPDYLE